MTAALQPQPAACATCGSPFLQPFCEHVIAALAAVTARPDRSLEDYFADVEPLFAGRLLEEVDAIVADAPPRRRYSGADLRRGYCPTAAYYAVRR